MRKNWLVALLLIPALVFSAAPANAGNGIRPTKEYQTLKSYVQMLNGERKQDVTPAQISKFRNDLRTRRSKASMKVRNLYQQQLGNAKDKRAQRKAKVVKLKQKRKRDLAQVRQAERNRLNQLAGDRRAAIARINTQYANQLNNLQKQRDKLRKKLAKAKSPVKKVNLRAELQTVQNQINNVSQAKQDDLNTTNNRYDNLVEVAKQNYDAKYESTQQQDTQAILDLQTSLRELYAQAKQNAQNRRANNFAEVKALYDRGVGYINEMANKPQPTPTPAP